MISKVNIIVGAIVVVATWLIVIVKFPQLPNQIPIHFDIMGNPTRFGNKIFLWVLPVVSTMIYLLLVFLSINPEKLNYPFDTSKNTQKIYQLAKNTLTAIAVVISIIFLTITHHTISVSLETTNPLSAWILIGLMAIIYFLIVSFIVVGRKITKW